MTGIEPSPYQKAIFEFIQDETKGSACIQAVAGSGKTTSLVEAARRIPSGKTTVFLAFNKINAEALKAKLPKHVRACTMNALGHGVWSRQCPGVEIDSNKIRIIVDKLCPKGEIPAALRSALVKEHLERLGDSDIDHYKESFVGLNIRKSCADLFRLIDYAKNCGLVPASIINRFPGAFRSFVEDERENWIAIVDSLSLDINRMDIAIAVARKALSNSIAGSGKLIDFNDQLYMPIISGAPFPNYDFVFVDESQDLNPLQVEMLARLRGERGRVIAIGDSRQAIYLFRGAVSSAMDRIKERFDCVELPLSVCYRCGKSIVNMAKTIVPHIEPFEDRHDGNITSLKEFTPGVFGSNDAVICRNTRPLVELAYKLIEAKVPCRIVGRDIEKSLTDLIDRQNATSIPDLQGKLVKYLEKERKRCEKSNKDERFASIKDRVQTLNSLIDGLTGQRSVARLKQTISFMFRDSDQSKKPVLSLMTIHKSKGSEFDNVFILEPQLLPSQYAKTPEAILQERNLMYVAITRAINKLYFISLEGLGEFTVASPKPFEWVA